MFGPSWGAPGRRRDVLIVFIEQMESSKRLPETFRGGFAPAPRLPFLLLIEEKEAKEDQGDDRLQVVRMGAESCLGLHRVRPNGRGGLFGPSWGAFDRRRRLVGAFAGALPPRPDFPLFS